MTEPIVVGVDASAPSRAAVEWAAEDARLRGLPLRVVRIEGAEPAGGVAVALLSLGSRASCTVLGLHGEDGVPGPAAGSVPHEVAARSNLPVLLVPGGGNGRTDRRWRTGQVALGVDARDPVSAVMDFAFDAARRRGARLHAVHAWRLPSCAEQWLPYALPEEDRGAWEDQEVQLLSDALRPWREQYPQAPEPVGRPGPGVGLGGAPGGRPRGPVAGVHATGRAGAHRVPGGSGSALTRDRPVTGPAG
ncbi:universal stress protein [Streptomyces sp. NBC_00268]|uniref:universal stress protein n=1 Tax=Streptomyces sp. NBC_00268 TaxID=2975695 RepID=UPI00224D32E5|nr:universal stress protein [Streptomyces sp. NBC_00268]MCX5181838.1 universal stress protein [Streptomyces sp. NBC_00268]